MKSAIIYYSYSGNTKKVADILCASLREKGTVDIVELQSLDEPTSFLGQCRRALVKTKAQIKPVNLDLSGYDLICFGSPVWAFGPTPAMNTYLDKCSGLESKPIILLTTYGSGTGNQRCLHYMQGILKQKGVKQFSSFSIQQFKVKDKEFVLRQIREMMRLWPNGYLPAGRQGAPGGRDKPL